MTLTITEPLGRPPAFSELQSLAGQYNVQINGNELAGDFCHPDPEYPKVTGHYTIEPGGNIRGDFAAHAMGKVAGTFALAPGRAEIVITEKPFLVPDTLLKSRLSAALKEFCARFSTPA